MNDVTKRIAVAVIRRGNQCLVGKRPEGVPLAGYDEFPGGKVEANESFEQAIVRECREETGLPIAISDLILEKTHDYPHGKLHLKFFEARVAGEMTTPNAPFYWVSLEELPELHFPEANDELLRILLES